METSREIAIVNAKLVLKQAGYFVDNLWRVEDVMLMYNVEDEQVAQFILYQALTNGATIEQIFFSIKMAAEDRGYKQIKLKSIDEL